MMKLTTYDGGRTDQRTGRDVVEEVYDLLRHRLPDLSPDDPARPALAATLTDLAPMLGRPTAEIVREGA